MAARHGAPGAPAVPDRFPEGPALREIFAHPAYRWAYPLLGAGIALGYAWLLPGLELWSLGVWVIQFVTPVQLAFALAMGALLPLVILLNVYYWRHPSCCRRTSSTERAPIFSAILGGVIPNLLCCTPFIPVLLAVFLSGAALLAVSPPIQYVLNAYAWTFYAVAVLSTWWSIRMTARRYSKESLWYEAPSPE